jgi:hypothetical protein
MSSVSKPNGSLDLGEAVGWGIEGGALILGGT